MGLLTMTYFNNNQELNKLNLEIQNYVRLESKGVISNIEFKEKTNPLKKRANELIHNFIEQDKKERIERNKIINEQKRKRDEEILKEKENKKLARNLQNKTYINDKKLPNNKTNVSHGGENKMVEEIKKEKKVSNASLILKALQLKSVKDYDAVAIKVVEWKPDADVKKIKTQAKGMIKELIAGIRVHSKVYDWDAENFMLTKKEVAKAE